MQGAKSERDDVNIDAPSPPGAAGALRLPDTTNDVSWAGGLYAVLKYSKTAKSVGPVTPRAWSSGAGAAPDVPPRMVNPKTPRSGWGGDTTRHRDKDARLWFRPPAPLIGTRWKLVRTSTSRRRCWVRARPWDSSNANQCICTGRRWAVRRSRYLCGRRVVALKYLSIRKEGILHAHLMLLDVRQ